MDKDKALDLALEALLINCGGNTEGIGKEAITAIKQARALDKKAENARELGLDYEPVRKPMHPEIKKMYEDYFDKCFRELSAAQRQWTGLTDEEVYPLANEHLHYQMEGYEVSGVYNLARAIEAKLKEKNCADH
jgi:hypothetical protein